MHVKVDFSPKCKENGYNIHMPGAYAVYTKRHIWNKWRMHGTQTYADVKLAEFYARELASMPKIIR